MGVSIYLRNLSTEKQTHGRGYMYLAQAIHTVRCKAADLCWRLYLRNLYMLASLSQKLVHRQTERQTDTLTWIYVPGTGCTHSLLQGSRSMLASLTISRTCPQTNGQTHGRGYMYLAHAVHIVRCKAADLCWRLYLRNLSTDRQTDFLVPAQLKKTSRKARLAMPPAT